MKTWVNDLQIKHCVTKTKSKKDIKRQNEKNLIFEGNVVVAEKKCDSDLNNYLSEEKKKNEKNIKRTFVDQKKKKKTKINNHSNITLIFIIVVSSNFWQSASILNQFIMNAIEFFFLSFRHQMTTANSSTAFLSSESNVSISSIIKSASVIALISVIDSIIDIAIFSATEIQRSFKYIVSMSLSEINEISYFQN